MKIKWTFLLYAAVNLLFLIVNLLTIEWTSLPCDNVSLVDAPANFALEGKWYTTAVFGDRYGNVYSGYPPLFEFLLIPLIWCFGLSLTTCRMLSVSLLFIVLLFAYKPVLRMNNGRLALIILSLLAWCGNIFAWIYRCERPDILIMVCCVGFLYNYYKGNSKWYLCLWAFLMFTAGFQCMPFLLGTLLCFYMFKSERPKLKSAILMLFAGSADGLFFLCVFFYAQGCLLSFFHRTFLFSDAARNMFATVFPYIEPYINKFIPDNINISESLSAMTKSSSKPFLTKFINGYFANRQFIFLSIINIAVATYLLISGTVSRKSAELKFLIITLILPMFMLLIGWYPPYYSWMGYIPAVLFAVYITAKYGKQKIVTAVYVIATLYIVFTGLPKTLIQADRDAYSNVKYFVKRQHFDAGSKVVAPFMSYYKVRNSTPYCYFAGLYPISLIPEDTEYVMWAENDYGDWNIVNYLELCKQNGKEVTAIDSIPAPKIVLYSIK